MAIVHSRELASLVLAGTGVGETIYTVPAETVVILRDWTFYNQSAASRTVSFQIVSGTGVRLVSGEVLAASSVSRPARQAWEVMPAGALLQAIASGASVRIRASGTVLAPL